MANRLSCALFLLPFFTLPASNASMLDQALLILANTKSGGELLIAAKRANIPILPGTISRTDITATRTLMKNRESLGFKTQVWVAQDKEALFQALDIAHELVHATHSQENPFDPNLSAEAYIKRGIEGDGGEARAIAKECEVGKELVENGFQGEALKDESAKTIQARCKFVWQTASDESRWKKSFYQLGHYYRDFLNQVAGLRLEMNESVELNSTVEKKSAMFHSAVARKPYPLALLEEYVEITKKVCNSSLGSSWGRAVASFGLTKRCQAVGVVLSE